MKQVLFLFFIQLFFSGLLAQSPVDSGFISAYNVILKTPTGDIHGALTTPNTNERTPVVLIVPGSGNTDRDCNSPASGVTTNTYRIIAATLAKNGISVLRFDKRGVGKSSLAEQQYADITFEDYINDVIGWIHYLRLEENFSKIILLGHSEGSLIGMIAAERTKVNSFISVDGAGKPAAQILREQIKSIPPELVGEFSSTIDSLSAGYSVKSVNSQLYGLFHPNVQPFMISWMRYDPAQEIARLKIPVMIIHGREDLQIPVEHAKILAAAKPDAKIQLIDKMNFVLKNVEGGSKEENLDTYRRPNLPVNDELLKAIVDFIK
jgi:pimeloyl-ACP methyl ester carboxylesterase